MVLAKNITKIMALGVIALPIIAGCGPKGDTGSASSGAKSGSATTAATPPPGVAGNTAAQTKAQNESIEKLKQYQAQQNK